MQYVIMNIETKLDPAVINTCSFRITLMIMVKELSTAPFEAK